MKTNLGLWIDHRKALVVAITDKGEETRLIISKLEKHLGRSGGKRSASTFESQLVPADDRRERRFTGLLQIYYDAVMACIRHADNILIFGPGEAKGELEKRLVKNKLAGRVVGMETVDKMTDHEIATKVRRFFRVKNGRKWTRTAASA